MSNDVFFFGAGFSKAINKKFPLLKDLTKDILGNNLENLPNYGFNAYIPNLCQNNIETLLTYLSSDLPWKSEKQKKADELLFIHITEKIQDLFAHSLIYNDITQSNMFDSLWQYIMKECIPIITLNYDLIPEKMLILNRKYNNREKIYTQNFAEYESLYRGAITNIDHTVCDKFSKIEYMPEIVKLHGSANWYYSGDEKYSPIYCGDKETQIEKALIGNMRPFIIPPVLDKTKFYHNKTLEFLWQKAFKYIVQAKNIYIIGFSFPLTDLSIRYLFESAIKSNRYNPTIYVINTQESLKKESEFYLMDKFSEVFQGNNLNFDYCCDNSLKKFTNEIIEPKLTLTSKN